MADTHYTEYWQGMQIAIAKVDRETPDSYQGFLCYASLKGKDRSIDRVAQLLGYHVGTVNLWSQQFKWQERSSAVDAQVFIKEQQERDQLTREDNERFARENSKVKDRAIKITNSMLDVAENLLKSATLAGKLVETGHIVDQDGRRVPTHTEIHMKAKISDIPRMVDSAIKNTRLVNELPTEIVRPVLPSSSQLKNMSTEELQQMSEDNREILVRHGVQSIIDQTGSGNN